MPSTLKRVARRWELRAPREPLVATEFELPDPSPDQALVRVVGCGVCHTDVGFLYDGVRTRHALPLALGHEIAGEVVDAGALYAHWIGKAVIVPAVTPCGVCASCRAGRGTICARQIMPGNDVHGGFASHVLVPARGLCEVDAAGALEGAELARSGCTLAELSVVADAVSTPYQAIRRSRLGEGDLALVVGLGGVGGFAAQIAHALGARVVGFDVASQRLDALAQYGLDLGLDPSKEAPDALLARVREFAGSHGLPNQGWRIFECSGTKAGQDLAWRLLVPGAWLSVIGFTREKVELRLSNLMAFDATAAGNWGCLPELYTEALQLALDGRIAIRPFVERHPMDQVGRILNDVREHRLAKRPVLVP